MNQLRNDRGLNLNSSQHSNTVVDMSLIAVIIAARMVDSKTNCRFHDQKCHQCGKIGHLKAACRSGTPSKVHTLTNDDEIFAIGDGHFYRVVRINGRRVTMVFDTGADVSLINEHVHNASSAAVA